MYVYALTVKPEHRAGCKVKIPEHLFLDSLASWWARAMLPKMEAGIRALTDDEIVWWVGPEDPNDYLIHNTIKPGTDGTS